MDNEEKRYKIKKLKKYIKTVKRLNNDITNEKTFKFVVIYGGIVICILTILLCKHYKIEDAFAYSIFTSLFGMIFPLAKLGSFLNDLNIKKEKILINEIRRLYNIKEKDLFYIIEHMSYKLPIDKVLESMPNKDSFKIY